MIRKFPATFFVRIRPLHASKLFTSELHQQE
jgi:hypothetical protein